MLKENHPAYCQTHIHRMGARKTRKFNIILVYCIAVSYGIVKIVTPFVSFQNLVFRAKMVFVIWVWPSYFVTMRRKCVLHADQIWRSNSNYKYHFGSKNQFQEGHIMVSLFWQSHIWRSRCILLPGRTQMLHAVSTFSERQYGRQKLFLRVCSLRNR